MGEPGRVVPSDVPEGISKQTIDQLPFALCITDPTRDDNPIVYINSSFERITGFSAKTAMNRNCRFLQGEETADADRQILREAIENREEATVDIVNYRADGEKFINRLIITPLHDDDGEVSHFLGILTERKDDRTFQERALQLDQSLREIQHRVKNHLQMLLSLIRSEARHTEDTQHSLDVLANRVESLNLLYEEFSTRGDDADQKVSLGAYISRVASALNMLDGHRDVILNVETEKVEASLDTASHIGLLVSELLTNALQHAFDGEESGKVEIAMRRQNDHLRIDVKDNGCGLPEGSEWPEKGNLGARIVRDLTRSLGGKIAVDSSKDGTQVCIDIPNHRLENRAG